LMAIIASIPIRMGLFDAMASPIPGYLPSPNEFFKYFIYINLTLMLFNLIPIAPLDGDKIAEYFLPPPAAHVFETIRPYGPIILIAILFVGPIVGVNVFGVIISPVLIRIYSLLVGVPT
jgi:Zn-dependent protease